MKKTILIEGKTFDYEEEQLDYDTTQPMSHADGVDLLHTVKRLLDAKGLEFYLGYGTLLGAVRNHDIIPGDEDLDIIVKDEQFLRRLLPYLHNEGLHLIRAYPGNVYSFRKGKNCYIDIYILRKISVPSFWSLYCYSIANSEYCPKRLWKETQTIDFLDQKFLCPKHPERVLAHWYGKDWMTPKTGHDFNYTVKSHYYFKHIKQTIKGIIGYDKWCHYINR